jgi:hypothetical protein
MGSMTLSIVTFGITTDIKMSQIATLGKLPMMLSVVMFREERGYKKVSRITLKIFMRSTPGIVLLAQICPRLKPLNNYLFKL